MIKKIILLMVLLLFTLTVVMAHNDPSEHDSCYDCGHGLFNVCDRFECTAIEGCEFRKEGAFGICQPYENYDPESEYLQQLVEDHPEIVSTLESAILEEAAALCAEEYDCGAMQCPPIEECPTCETCTTQECPRANQIRCNNGYYEFCENPDNCNWLQLSVCEGPNCGPVTCGTNVCVENWECSSWSDCSNDQQTRECEDANACGTMYEKPATTQSCSCVENWECSAWTTCTNAQQTRVCEDANGCGSMNSKPVESQSCTTEEYSTEAILPRPPAGATNIPKCTNHDPTIYHALYDPVHNCHYDHHHNDDPNRVNDIFGPVGAAFDSYDGVMDGKGPSISYPWQTWKGAGVGASREIALANNEMENDLKHEGYRWLVRRQEDYYPGSECASGTTTETCLTDFRIQAHAILAPIGAMTRFHSGWLEARICKGNNPNGECGIVRSGGWIDYGKLVLMTKASQPDKHYPLPNDPENLNMGARRIHESTLSQGFPTNDATWYDGVSHIELSIRGAAWGPFDEENPENNPIYNIDVDVSGDSGHRFETESGLGDWMEAHVVSVPGLKYWWHTYDGSNLDEDGKEDGFITFHGYTNQYGDIKTDCTKIDGVNCIPLILEHVPIGLNQYRENVRMSETGIQSNYDTSPDGEYWLTWFEDKYK